jgi:hypothetical protein
MSSSRCCFSWRRVDVRRVGVIDALVSPLPAALVASSLAPLSDRVDVFSSRGAYGFSTWDDSLAVSTATSCTARASAASACTRQLVARAAAGVPGPLWIASR